MNLLEIDSQLKMSSNTYPKKEIVDLYKVKTLNKNMPSIIGDINDDLPEGSSLFLAGGAIRSVFTNNEINDYDLYLVTDIEDDETYGELLSTIVEDFCDSTRFVSCTDKSLLVSHNGILINFVFFKKFKTVENIFESFDFTCVMGAFDIKNDKFFVSEKFLVDNISNTLTFNTNTSFPIMSLLRVKKYTDKGYSISRNEMLKICLKISGLKIDSFQLLKKHIGGMYGIDIEKIFDIEKPFDIENVINEISELDIDFDLVLDHDTDYSALHLLRINLSKANYTYYKFKDKYSDKILLISNGVLIGVIEDTMLTNTDFNIKPHSGKFKVYKYVGYDGTKFYSQREKDFIYNLGEMIYPKDKNTGLFCGSLNKRKSFTFCNEKGSTLIELLVDGNDIKNINSYDSHSTRIGVSNMEVNKFVFKKMVEVAEKK